MNEYDAFPAPSEEPVFPTGNKELRFAAAIAIACLLLANFAVFHGYNLGFALAAAGCIVITTVYLLRSGCKPDFYSTALLALSLVLCGSFVRSNDGFVKFVSRCFLLVSANLGFCLLAAQNRRCPGGVSSLLDAPRALFMLGVGGMGAAARGLNAARKDMSATGKSRSAVAAGIAVAVPVALVLVSLLVSADAAFEGLLALLPEIDLGEVFVSLLLGGCAACLLYTRGIALKHSKKEPLSPKERKGMHPLTVNTVLICVCCVYGVYLFSQLAYVSGGFLGILPEGYTLAEYARRGFFEMCALCALNLAIITLAVGLSRQTGKAIPWLCLLIGLMNLFFVTAASAKMLLYIGSYGLTRLRLLTEVITVFLGITTVFVCLWLFVPKFRYMKAVLLTALTICAATAWVDVDTVVAHYNVRAWQSGILQTVDVNYLGDLSAGAVPYLQELAQCSDPWVAEQAKRRLQGFHQTWDGDLRSYTIAGAVADEILDDYLPSADRAR